MYGKQAPGEGTETAGLNSQIEVRRVTDVRGWERGEGVDAWDFFLWPQYKHLEVSIKDYSEVSVDIK
jgi:hypothetical protein